MPACPRIWLPSSGACAGRGNDQQPFRPHAIGLCAHRVAPARRLAALTATEGLHLEAASDGAPWSCVWMTAGGIVSCAPAQPRMSWQRAGSGRRRYRSLWPWHACALPGLCPSSHPAPMPARCRYRRRLHRARTARPTSCSPSALSEPMRPCTYAPAVSSPARPGSPHGHYQPRAWGDGTLRVETFDARLSDRIEDRLVAYDHGLRLLRLNRRHHSVAIASTGRAPQSAAHQHPPPQPAGRPRFRRRGAQDRQCRALLSDCQRTGSIINDRELSFRAVTVGFRDRAGLESAHRERRRRTDQRSPAPTRASARATSRKT